MLSLGHKYRLDHLHAEALRCLKQYFPDNHSREIPSLLPPSGWASPKCSVAQEPKFAIPVINLARTQGLDCLLPAAFFVTVYLQSDHLVNGFADGNGHHWKLSAADMTRCLTGRENPDAAVRRHHEWIFSPILDTCEDQERCKAASQVNASHLLTASFRSDHALHTQFALHSYDVVETALPEKYCKACSEHNKRTYEAERQDTWKSLRKFFDLPMGGTLSKKAQMRPARSTFCIYLLLHCLTLIIQDDRFV